MRSKLAIDGGAPVRNTFLPYGRQWVGEADIQAVQEVLYSDFLTTGPKVCEFEQQVAEFVGTREAVAVNSGTAALHAAAFAAGIEPKDEVITTALTFAATANCIVYLGGRPVFADVRADTLNIDSEDVARKISPRTKAIITVDFAGQPCDYQGIRALAEKHRLIVIEDAAHALGAEYNGQRAGSLNELTAFSFHPVKHITTGEGGMVVTNDSDLAVKMRTFRSHGITADFRQRAEAGSWVYEMVALGYNYRLPDINCALGLAQMRKLDEWLARRREIAARYTEALAQMPEVELPSVLAETNPAWHLYVVKLNVERLCVGRKEIFAALQAENIGVNVHYIPVYWHPYYQRLGYARGSCPVAEAAYERLISLPIFPAMTNLDVYDVIEAIGKVIDVYRK
ncbi:MAG: UDP-4-amino-4,6-dideoxy-N-acetyl-beta-L-altrosamine transaminase [Candidatus Hodarchaeota archaeon]